MFDVSLSELMVIGVVALVVIGPERLPRVARTLGHLVGRLQRYVGQVKADINREMQLDDLKKFHEQMAAEATKIKSSITSVGDEIREVETTLKESITNSVSPAPTGEMTSPSADLDAAVAMSDPANVASSEVVGANPSLAPTVSLRDGSPATPTPATLERP